MTRYRRLRIPGGTYFFTVNLERRGDDTLIRHIDDLRRAYAATHCEHPFRTDAIVVLPDHLHAVWTLPPGDADYSERWRKIKARFSHMVGRRETPCASKVKKREVGLWQRRFWEHTIRDAADYQMHMAYCWSNPVKHGYVRQAADWSHSSIHRDIRLGRVDPQWCGAVLEGAFGE